MMKNSTRGYAIVGILFAVVSVVAFAVPVRKTAAFWLVYAFTAAAFAAQIVIWKKTLGREELMKSKFLGFPVLHISIVYLLVQLVTFAVFLFMPTLPVWSAVVVCVVVAGFFAVCMIAAETGRAEIERVEDKTRKKVFYIRSLQVEVEVMAERENDRMVKAELVRLAEKIRFSDPMSDESLAGLEEQIAARISELETAEDKAALIQEIDLLLGERNRKCKMRKE